MYRQTYRQTHTHTHTNTHTHARMVQQNTLYAQSIQSEYLSNYSVLTEGIMPSVSCHAMHRPETRHCCAHSLVHACMHALQTDTLHGSTQRSCCLYKACRARVEVPAALLTQQAELSWKEGAPLPADHHSHSAALPFQAVASTPALPAHN